MIRIHPEASVHPTTVLEGEVEIGAGTVIGPFCWIRGPVVIGKNNVISPQVSIGGEPEHRMKGGEGSIFIGDDNRIRENCVIHRGTGARDTRIGSRCYLMDHVHVSHDSLIEDDVTLAHNTVLAGHCVILQGATTGIATVLHQHSTLGSFAMTGMGSVITRDVPPFFLVQGNPARFSRLNRHAFAKAGIQETELLIHEGVLQGKSPAVQAWIDRFASYSKRSRVVASSRH